MNRSGTKQASGWHLNLPPNGRLDYWQGVFGPARAKPLFAALCSELNWAQRSIVMFGREVAQPRLVAFHGAEGVRYRYSGRTLAATPWTSALHTILGRLRTLLDADFNSVLANRYRDGNDAMGWHADDEPELGPDPLIASVSFGAERRFLLRPKAGGKSLSLALADDSLLVMSGDLQHHWQHQLPRTRLAIGERINLTFRRIRCCPGRA